LTRTVIEVQITPIPITGTIGCCVPVVPGTPETEAPMERRTERCAVDAHWLIGACPTCDIHAQVMCEIAGWDWRELWQEAGRQQESVARSWDQRQRHSQEDAERHFAHFAGTDA
jgi:hypothetical protein